MSTESVFFICRSWYKLFSSFMTNSRNMLNSVGERIQPWRTPMLTLNHSVMWPSITIAHSVSLYSASMMLTIFVSTPMAIIILHRAFLHTVSKADLKSMKLKCNGTWCSLAFSMICLTIKIASTVPLPCLNPNWLFSTASSVFSFILFKIILLKTLPGIDRSDIAL